MNTLISKFLKNYYIEGVFYTHVSLVSPKGAYQLNRDSIEEFWNIYCNNISESNKLKKNITVGVAEKPGYYIPVLGDIDIKLIEEEADCINYEDYFENEEKHLYTKKNLKDVIEVYQSVLRNIIEGCTEDMLLCIVLEKSIYREIKTNVTYVKNGFHLHFPNCFLSKIDHETQLLPRVKQIMKELKIFENLGIEDSGELVDTGYVKTPWLLYGGKKENDKIKSGETMQPYLITKIINSVGEEISIQEAFKYYNIYDVREQLINIQDNIEYHLPRIMSIIPNGRMCCELKYGLSLPLKEKYINKEKDRENFNNTADMPVIEALKISKKLLPMLSSFRADDRNEWMTIGWVLFNIGDGCPEALEQWIEFSSRNEEKFDENECVFQWERMTKKDFTLGTLRYFAKIDNEEAYKEFTKEQGERYIRESLEGSHNDIAKLLYNEYGTEFVCSSVTNRTWFQYKNHHWEEIEEGVFLRELISNDLVKLYGKHGGDIFANSAVASPDDNSFQLKIKQTQKLISNLKNSSYKSHVMREACEVFFNKNFKNKLDSNPFLIGFKNGVYDLKLDLFRTGRPEDYISKQMTINYINFNKTDDRVHAVEDFLEKVFPDTSVKNYFLDTSSDIFEGGNKQKTINFWTGEGDNAKSVTQTILEKILGPYAIKFTTTLVTGKKSTIGAASPELSRAGGGVRLAVLEEPDGDEQLNIGILKSLSGNDSYWARDLFERGKSTREIQPLFKLIFICNKLPATRNADQAFWNRAKVTPFESTFVRPGSYVPSDPSEQLLQKKFPMDTEFARKIPNLLEPMAWKLLEHRKNIKGKGRVEPDKVKMASELYRKQNDIYRQFKDECIIECENYITLIQLYSSFREWFKMSYPGYTMPLRNDLQEYFTKVWDEPEKGLKWYGYKVKSLDEEIEDGNAFILGDGDLQEYDDTNSICSKGSGENKKIVPKRKSPNKRILPPV